MFFAILGESQANVRDDQRQDRNRSKGAGEASVPEYGIITQGYEFVMNLATHLPVLGPRLQRQRSEAKIEEIQEAIESNGPTAVYDRGSNPRACAEAVVLLAPRSSLLALALTPPSR